MKVGLSLKIDVTKIDKSRLFKGEKGTYLDVTCLLDIDNTDQYGNNGFIVQETTKREREQGIKLPILGNAKIYYNDSRQQGVPNKQQPAQPEPFNPDDDDESMPF